MKIKSYHITNLGSFSPRGVTVDSQGYVTYHAAARYSTATSDQLSDWSQSRIRAVRNAALTEIAERKLSQWQSR